jgi:shikimate kinase
LPGSGKTTIAPLVAARLGTRSIDLDHQIVLRSGRTIAQLFVDPGEVAFRELEREAMAGALAGPAAVIAPGGGWAAQPGNLAAVETRALTLYLYVTPEVASKRLGAALDRPLLAADPRPRLGELLAERQRWYRLAGLEIDATGPAELVAEAVVTAARQYGGWLPAPGEGGY